MAENNIQSGDYLSPASVKNALADFFRFFFRCLDFFVSAIRSYWIIFLSSCLFGLVLAYLYTALKEDYYETEMIVQQSSLTRKAYYEIVRNLDKMIQSGSQTEIASELHLDNTAAGKLISFETVDLANESLANDTSTRTGYPFKVRVKVKDNSILPLLQKGLLDYLNNNDYAKTKREGQKKFMSQKLAFIDRELSKLDSLEATYSHTLAAMKLPSAFYNNALNPADLYVHALNLAGQKEYLSNWLNTEGNGILLIDGFKTPENPRSPPKLLLMFLGLCAGICLGAALSLLMAIKQKVK